MAAGLAACGVRPGTRVAILSATRWKWAVADMAIMGLGAGTVPIEHNSSSEDRALSLWNSVS